MEADNVLITCLTYNYAARVSPKKYFVQQFAGVEELRPCTLDKCGQSIFILATTAAVPIATSAVTPVGPCCQSRPSGSRFQKPAPVSTNRALSEVVVFRKNVTPSSRGIGKTPKLQSAVLPASLRPPFACGQLRRPEGEQNPLQQIYGHGCLLGPSGVSGDHSSHISLSGCIAMRIPVTQ